MSQETTVQNATRSLGNPVVDPSAAVASAVSRSAVFAPLDAARGLAALAVVAFHLRYTDSVQQSLPFIHALASRGFLGVQLFFVVSGYCLAASASSSLRRNESSINFLKRRFLRIYPPLWCSMVVVAALPYLKWLVLEKTGGDVTWPTPLFANFRWWDWIATGTLLQAFRFGDLPLDEKFGNFNVVYWSLAIEVQFYMVMAAAIRNPRLYYPILGLVTLLGCVVSSQSSAQLVNWNSGIFLPFWPMFAMGILVYEARSRNWTSLRWLSTTSAAAVSFCGCCAAAILGIYHLGSGGSFSGIQFAFIVATFFWMSIPVEDWLRQTDPRLSRVLGFLFKPLVWLGTISYTVYLLHFNLHKLPGMILTKVLPPESAALQLLLTVAVCLMCYPFYLCCEQPFIRARSGKN
jgi:peptidoglycan/LPS O-acetylase OafA/YrhL